MIRLAQGRFARLYVCAVLDDYGCLTSIRFGLNPLAAERRCLIASRRAEAAKMPRRSHRRS